ncbi:ABATE domain-containing protein [Streptosporangium sp. NBC_01495]|uniref:ABATE domain-containing protein n=1 Tax=Streptosporangium sp. NBC_01495 TaxID=2903899 RepID=UPI002E335F88|nr:ABATE domain-containing protein [Streptosporangium sp. NBC_01495]
MIEGTKTSPMPGERPLAADLANRRPATAGELADRCRAAGLVLEHPVTSQDLDRVHPVMEAWEKVVDAADERERAEPVNRMLADSAAHPRLTDHADGGWHLHYRDDSRPLGSVLFALISAGGQVHVSPPAAAKAWSSAVRTRSAG